MPEYRLTIRIIFDDEDDYYCIIFDDEDDYTRRKSNALKHDHILNWMIIFKTFNLS